MPYIEQREFTASQWTALNIVLLKGEVGWESGATPKAKKGDGVTPWNSLPYAIVPGAPIASPAFTGNPTAPTPATNDNDTSVATTAFVKAQAYAPLASPTLTGDPKAPTPATADNDTSIATTAFVKAQAYAPLGSPALTGNPTAPTPAVGDNDTSIATTAFVRASVAAQYAAGVVAGLTNPTPNFGSSTQVTITLPAGRFSTPPVPFAYSGARVSVELVSVSATQVVFNLWNFSSGATANTVLYWFAVAAN